MFLRLRDLREDSDKKQREIAGFLGCTQVCYSCYETGRHGIPTAVLVKLALYYDTSVDYLLGITPEKKRRSKRPPKGGASSDMPGTQYERMRALRREGGMRQCDIAEYLNCSQVCYSFYEIGRRDMPPEVLVKLAAYYNTSVDYLLGLTDEKNPYPRASK